MPKISRVKLTTDLVKRAKYDPEGTSKQILWDRDIVGFGLRILPHSKRFVLRYRTAGGRERLMALGQWGPLTVDQAREMAQTVLSQVTRSKLAGIDHDPVEEKRVKATEPVTVADLWRYYERTALAKQRPRSRAEAQGLWRRHVEPRLGHLDILEATESVIQIFHAEVGETAGHVTANRALIVVSAIFNARPKTTLPDLPNPAREVEHFREAPRERFLKADEYRRLGDAINDLEARGLALEAAATYFRVLALTGLRASEVRCLRWEDLDPAKLTAKLQETKAGKPRYAPIGAAAMQLLLDLPQRCEWVFPGVDLKGPMANPQKLWERLRKAAGLKGVRMHDLRHSLASVAVNDGSASLRVLGHVMGHARPETTERYAHVLDEAAAGVAQVAANTIAERMGLGAADTPHPEPEETEP